MVLLLISCATFAQTKADKLKSYSHKAKYIIVVNTDSTINENYEVELNSLAIVYTKKEVVTSGTLEGIRSKKLLRKLNTKKEKDLGLIKPIATIKDGG